MDAICICVLMDKTQMELKMLLKYVAQDSLVEIEDVGELINPVEQEVPGRKQSGQEEQESEKFAKTDLIFPSGESLPRCWTDANYLKNN